MPSHQKLGIIENNVFSKSSPELILEMKIVFQKKSDGPCLAPKISLDTRQSCVVVTHSSMNWCQVGFESAIDIVKII